MASIEILNEQEHAGGWVFQTEVDDETGPPRSICLTLSWADYNLWSPDGADAPERVAEAVLAFLLSRESMADIRPRFDAALARRFHQDADEFIPTLIRRPL